MLFLYLGFTVAFSGEEIIEEEWSSEHVKVLYLIYKFARAAEEGEEERWIRETPLSVCYFIWCILFF